METKFKFGNSHIHKTLLFELNQSKLAFNQINKTIQKNFEEKGIKKIERKRVHYYFSKENGTNLGVTEYLNPFEQKENDQNAVNKFLLEIFKRPYLSALNANSFKDISKLCNSFPALSATYKALFS